MEMLLVGAARAFQDEGIVTRCETDRLRADLQGRIRIDGTIA